MASLFKKAIVVLGTIVSFLYLICTMGLLSSIIIWLSLEFTPALPSTLAFIIGVPCLASAIVGILMFGIPRREALFTVIFILLAIFTILAGVSVMGPFINLYTHERSDLIGEFCDDCDYIGKKTVICVDACHDECCFTNYSAPLVRVFIAFTATALAVSVAAVVIGFLHLYIVLNTNDDRRKKHGM